jgi:hypothetical protein
LLSDALFPAPVQYGNRCPEWFQIYRDMSVHYFTFFFLSIDLGKTKGSAYFLYIMHGQALFFLPANLMPLLLRVML